MADEVDKLALTMMAFQLYPAVTDEQLAEVLGVQRVRSVLFWKLKARQLLEQGQVVCEVCGTLFLASQGYYEPGVYAYCAGCCRW